MRQSFQFKLFVCKRLKHLHRTIDVSAHIWNHAVALHRRYYRLFKKTLPESKLKAHLAKLRNTRFPHWQTVGSQSVQAIVERLYLGWAAFFKAAADLSQADQISFIHAHADRLQAPWARTHQDSRPSVPIQPEPSAETSSG